MRHGSRGMMETSVPVSMRKVCSDLPPAGHGWPAPQHLSMPARGCLPISLVPGMGRVAMVWHSNEMGMEELMVSGGEIWHQPRRGLGWHSGQHNHCGGWDTWCTSRGASTLLGHHCGCWGAACWTGIWQVPKVRHDQFSLFCKHFQGLGKAGHFSVLHICRQRVLEDLHHRYAVIMVIQGMPH